MEWQYRKFYHIKFGVKMFMVHTFKEKAVYFFNFINYVMF